MSAWRLAGCFAALIIAACAAAPAAPPMPGREASGAALPEARAAIRPEQGRIGDRFDLFVAAEPPTSGSALESEALAPGAKLGSFRILEADRSRPGEITLTLTPETTGDLEVPGFDVTFHTSSPAPTGGQTTPAPATPASSTPTALPAP